MSKFLVGLEYPKNNIDTKEILEAWQDCKVIHLRIQDLQSGDVMQYYDRLLPQIGTPCALAEDVKAGSRQQQRTGETWMEVRYDPAYPNAYRHSASAQPLHTDGSYIPSFPNATLMCCVANAADGGETVFLDSELLVEILQQENPDLLDLKTITIPHTRSGDSRNLPVLRHERGGWRVNWNYFCVDPDINASVAELRETFHQFLLTSQGVQKGIVPVKLQPGDAVFWKDEELLHGRNAFNAQIASERFLWKCAIDVGIFAGVLS
jgi:alpha-ketoglutarate-dependent taurine dioxygenase